MKHNAAVRKLARSWIRILYRVWQSGEVFDGDAHACDRLAGLFSCAYAERSTGAMALASMDDCINSIRRYGILAPNLAPDYTHPLPDLRWAFASYDSIANHLVQPSGNIGRREVVD